MSRFAIALVVLSTAALALSASVPVAHAQGAGTTSIALVLRRGNAEARAIAAARLATTGDPAAAAYLIRSLERDADANVRAACVVALASFETAVVHAALERALRDQAEVVRTAARTALAEASVEPESVESERGCARMGFYPVDLFEHYYDVCGGALVRRSRRWPVD